MIRPTQSYETGVVLRMQAIDLWRKRNILEVQCEVKRPKFVRTDPSAAPFIIDDLHYIQKVGVFVTTSAIVFIVRAAMDRKNMEETLAWRRLTQWMAAAQLRLLLVFPLKFIADAVQQLHVALLRVLLQSGDERPAHCSSSLPGNVRI